MPVFRSDNPWQSADCNVSRQRVRSVKTGIATALPKQTKTIYLLPEWRGLAAAIRADAALPYTHARLATPPDDPPALPGLNSGWDDNLPPINRRN